MKKGKKAAKVPKAVEAITTPTVEVAVTPKAPKAAKKSAKATKAEVATPKAAQPVAAPTVTLLRMPKEGELKPGQALTILEILKAHKGPMPLPELLKEMEGRIVTKNVLGLKDVVFMVRPRLIEGGFIEFKKGGRS